MVSSVPFDIVADPETAIQEVFDKHVESQSTEEFSRVLSDYTKQMFEGDDRTALVSIAISIYSFRYVITRLTS